MGLHVAFGIFAHDEERDLPRLLDNLSAQDILRDPETALELHLLANGCTDGTVSVARAHEITPEMGKRFIVHDLAEPGKSRSWNRFVHELADPEADFLGFLDADIRLTDPTHLSRMVKRLARRPELSAFGSRPVADPAGATTPVARAILRGGGTSDDWRRAICGQCYILRADVARRIHFPIGLPVEDGFLRAMLVTECFESAEVADRIDGDPTISHLFEPERSLFGYLRHQERIVVGSSVNTALFADLSAAPAGTRAQRLAEAATDPGWVATRLRERLPTRRYGFVPWHFLFKRTTRMLRQVSRPADLARLVRLPVYFLLDFIVFLRAQMRLAKGIGTNFW